MATASINIAGMQVSRQSKGEEALCVLALDSALSPEVLDSIKRVVSAERAAIINLAD